MIDRSLPFRGLTLYKENTSEYPKKSLPEGYRFELYRDGDEVKWAEIECAVGQFESIEEGVDCFRNEFLKGQTLDARERVFFVVDDNGEYVATAALWHGTFLGKTEQRVHWVAVKDKCAGKGIAGAMLTHVLDMFKELGYEGLIFLLTATWYYPAIGIYRKFGFEFFRGDAHPMGEAVENFREHNDEAISWVEEKLQAYKK
ncbi:MAG: GNAT family N-acetyltransferase [Clostridia bacterium]|nr:GNAT family N-acetyltransferase [Clostridia bacterium]